MGRLLGKRAYRELFLGLAIVCAALALILWPKEAMAAMKDGLACAANVIIPSLFPFFGPVLPGGGAGLSGIWESCSSR